MTRLRVSPARELAAKAYTNVRDYEEGKRGWVEARLCTKATSSEGASMETQSQNPRIAKGYEDLIESTILVHVATIVPHGEPQNNPVWFDWDGQPVRFSQTRARQKYHSLQRGPRAALSIFDPENSYRYLEVRGEVDHVEEDPNLDFINSMAKKYLGMDRYPYHQPGDERVVIFMRPGHTTQMGE